MRLSQTAGLARIPATPMLAGALAVFCMLCSEAADTPARAKRDYENARTYEAQGRLDEAIDRYLALSKAYPLEPIAGRGLFRAGQLYKLRQDYLNSFASFQQLIEKGCAEDFFLPAVQQQYQIALEVMEQSTSARKETAEAGRPKSPGYKEAGEMLKLILESARQTGFAPKAKFSLAAVQARQGETEEARETLHQFLTDYPDSNLVDDVQFQLAYMDYVAGIEGRGNLEFLDRANDGLLYFLMTHPGSDRVPVARHLLEDIERRRFLGLVEAASYYEKTGAEPAAQKYYREILVKFPHLAGEDVRYPQIKKGAGMESIPVLSNDDLPSREKNSGAP